MARFWFGCISTGESFPTLADSHGRMSTVSIFLWKSNADGDGSCAALVPPSDRWPLVSLVIQSCGKSAGSGFFSTLQSVDL